MFQPDEHALFHVRRCQLSGHPYFPSSKKVVDELTHVPFRVQTQALSFLGGLFEASRMSQCTWCLCGKIKLSLMSHSMFCISYTTLTPVDRKTYFLTHITTTVRGRETPWTPRLICGKE
ncbi:hypothetical protein TNCV_4566581 [Trichonephila clavipes]|nr:hypothetical protein TNCV_4566581 [Trichonephila clavipes]